MCVGVYACCICMCVCVCVYVCMCVCICVIVCVWRRVRLVFAGVHGIVPCTALLRSGTFCIPTSCNSNVRFVCLNYINFITRKCTILVPGHPRLRVTALGMKFVYIIRCTFCTPGQLTENLSFEYMYYYCYTILHCRQVYVLYT